MPLPARWSFCRWRSISDEPGQMFGTVTPGGCEQLFIDVDQRHQTLGWNDAADAAAVDR